MERKILYLINPVAGTGNKKKLEELIKVATEKTKKPFAIQPTDPEGHYTLAEERIRKEGFTDICICGGDGTINAVIQRLNHLPVRFGIIPAGSGNGLAFSAGIPSRTTKALDVFLEGKTRRIDAFRVNDAFACMLSGLGFDAEVAHHFAGERNRGLGKYAWLTVKTFFKTASHTFRLRCHELDFTSDAFFICVANSNQFGNHITITPRADLSDGLLDVFIAQKQSKLLLVCRLLYHLIAGKVKKAEESLSAPILYFQTTELEIENVENVLAHIDGEARPNAKKMSYKVLPRYFELIC